MYYVYLEADATGNHGNPVSTYVEGMVPLADDVLSTYIQTMGFANLTVVNEIVTHVTIDQDAYDAYIADHSEEQEEPNAEEDIMSMAVDHEYRILMLELGITE